MTRRHDTVPRLTHQGLRVLKVFLEEPTRQFCGAELIKATGLPSGTIYPIMLRFERSGLLKSRWETEEPTDIGRPRRRLYNITPTGCEIARETLAGLFLPLQHFVPVRN